MLCHGRRSHLPVRHLVRLVLWRLMLEMARERRPSSLVAVHALLLLLLAVARVWCLPLNGRQVLLNDGLLPDGWWLMARVELQFPAVLVGQRTFDA